MPGIKIKLFLIIMVSGLLTMACNREKNDVIPDITVDFNINFSDPEFFDFFQNPGSSFLISQSHTYLYPGIGTGGYDNNGIILYNTGMNDFEFCAYDRTCPYCYTTRSLSIAVTLNGVYAECPECGTSYALPSFGTPTSAGPGQYPLKNYHTGLNGAALHVWNRK
jgi:hypothetical protein